jgi:hypothetical protein
MTIRLASYISSVALGRLGRDQRNLVDLALGAHRRSRLGLVRLERGVDRGSVLAPEVVRGPDRVIVAVPARAERHQLLPWPKPVDWEPHDVADSILLHRSLPVRFFPIHLTSSPCLDRRDS